MTAHATRRAPLRGGAAGSGALALGLAAALSSGVSCTRVATASNPPRVDALPCRQIAAGGSDAVVWWSPPGDHAREELSRWCETVGPVVFQPAPAAPSDRAIDSLAVVSWNVHVGGGDVAALVRALGAGEFTGGAPVGDFVLLLQEAYRRDAAVPSHMLRWHPVPDRIAARTGRGPDVVHVSRDEGVALLYAPSMRNGIIDVDREDRGNAILSTLPLGGVTVVELPLQRQRRVAPAAVIAGHTTGGLPWTLRVVDVHLDTALALLHGGPFAARRRQAETLAAAIAATAPRADHLTTIVAGDFNTVMGAREPAIAYLRRVFPDGPAPLQRPTFRGPLGFHANLDHVFVAGRVKSITVRRLPDRFGSDHYPLLTTVNF